MDNAEGSKTGVNFGPKSTHSPPSSGKTHGRSKLEIMRRQFVSKQAYRTNGNDTSGTRPKISSGANKTPERPPKPGTTRHVAPASARNILNSVIGKEMRTAKAKQNDTSTHTPSTADSEESHAPGSHQDEDVATVPPAGRLDQRIGETDIRERLRKQQSRRPIQRGAMTYRLKDHEKQTTQDNSAPNENILERIRAKGPMVARNNHDTAAEETEKETNASHASPQARNTRPNSPKVEQSRILANGRSSPRGKRVPSPVARGQGRGRNPSPKGRNPSPLNRPPSPNSDGISPYSPEDTGKKVARVMKARLYLLQQNGPNSFRIGGDSPEHKFRVIVGPQSCSCGRAFCIHILFVMLRVFRLDPTSPLLWRRKLKNFEVDTLLRSYHDRCNSRISPKRKSRVKRMVSQISHGNAQQDTSSNSDDRSSKGEEENCPICLLQMVDEEPITVCEVGCRNKLHTHCVDIWAEECRRNADALKCPLCRVVWKPAETTKRPFMVEIPREYEDTADTWVRAFGWELVVCLFSSHPNIRENGLRRLSHDITGALLITQPPDVPDDNSEDSDRSSPRGASADPEMSSLFSNASLSSCCSILAMVCADPEYKVYITALRTFRAMLAYTQCQTLADVKAFQKLLSPVIETVLLKCADSNIRALQLSVSTIMELCKGQRGELAVGKEIASESKAVGDLEYVIGFLEMGRSPDSSSWQWMLGRLNVINDLFKEFRNQFLSREGHVDPSDGSDLALSRLTSIIKFGATCLRLSKHQKVIKMAHKIFVQAVNLGSRDSHFITECMQLLQNLDHPRLKKRVAQFLPDHSDVNSDWLDLSQSYDDHLDAEEMPAMGSVAVKSPAWENNPSVGEVGMATSSLAVFPMYTVTSHRATYPTPQFAGPLYNLPTSPAELNGDLEEELGYDHIEGDYGSCIHPPTPPPSSDNTTNLADAIQVSLFRPIRCLSPQEDTGLPLGHYPPVLDGRARTNEGGVSQHLMEVEEIPPQIPPRAPITPQAVLNKEKKPIQEPSKSAPVTPATPDRQLVPESRRQRPTLLRLRSESSAFRQTRGFTTVGKKDATPDSETSLSPSGRDRSSSRESDASVEGLFRGSERRMSVRELAESINRKQGRPHAPHLKKDAQGKVFTQVKNGVSQHMERGDMNLLSMDSPTKSVSAVTPTKQTTELPTPDGIQASSTHVPKRPPVLSKYESHPISRSIARRGTMERYKEKKRLESLANPPQPLHEQALPPTPDSEHPDGLTDPGKPNPPLNLYSRSTESSPNRSKLPKRGILKNGDHKKLAPAGARQKSSTTDTSRASTSSGDYLSAEDKDPPTSVTSPCRSGDDFNPVFTHEDHPLSDEDALKPVRTGSDSDSDYVSLEKKFENARDSITDLHESLAGGGPVGVSNRPMRPKQLKRNAKSPTREASRASLLSPTSARQAVKHVTESMPTKDGKESLFYVRTVRDDDNRPGTSKQRQLPPLPPKEGRKQNEITLGISSPPENQGSLEDLESDTSQADKTPVTFKTEIGEDAPNTDNVNNTADFSSIVRSDYATDITHACSCQAQIAEEESKLFARALAISYVQDALPTIPRLSYSEYDENIVTSQDENTDPSQEYRMDHHWVKGHQIGLGALSSCFQARDVFTGTLMAVKQVNYQRCSDREQAQVLDVIEKEIEMMRHLSHPNIVRLHGATKEMGLCNVFFEWCAGGSVSTLLNKFGPFTESVISNYALQILRGLAYLHERHIVHRDIKGANLLIDSTGQRLRIGDFGAAARLATKCTGAGEFQGQLLGTIAFMAPEVLRGEHYGRSCDIWGCGCVITEMATGKPPWEADQHSNHLSLIFKIASSPSTPLIPTHLSPAMRDLCKRCLEPKATDRPPADELLKHPVFIRW